MTLPDDTAPRRLAAVALWSALISGYALILLPWVVPAPTDRSGPLHAGLAWIAFMVETFYLHGGVAASAIAVIVLRRGRRVLAMAAVPLLGVMLLPECGRWWPRVHPPPGATVMRVMTFNLLASNANDQAVLEEIQNQDPDILMLQEYDPGWHAALTVRLGERWPYAHHAIQHGHFGAALYSKQPLLDAAVMPADGSDRSTPVVTATVVMDGRAVRLATTHLWPPTRAAFIARFGEQVGGLLHQVGAGPSIIGGDFNAGPRSTYLRPLRNEGFHSAWDLAGWGVGPTWPDAGWLTSLVGVRIDHVFVRELIVARVTIGRACGSDHRPVVADVAFPRSAVAHPANIPPVR